eukprot:172727-Pyramimonas_sp.AAC.1
MHVHARGAAACHWQMASPEFVASRPRANMEPMRRRVELGGSGFAERGPSIRDLIRSDFEF